MLLRVHAPLWYLDHRNTLGLLLLMSFIYDIIVIASPAEEQGGFVFNRLEATIEAVLNILLVAACVSLIYGTLKERTNFIAVWIIAFYVSLASMIFYVAHTLISGFTDSQLGWWEIPCVLVIMDWQSGGRDTMVLMTLGVMGVGLSSPQRRVMRLTIKTEPNLRLT